MQFLNRNKVNTAKLWFHVIIPRQWVTIGSVNTKFRLQIPLKRSWSNGSFLISPDVTFKISQLSIGKQKTP